MDTIHWLNKNLEHTLMWIISILRRIYSSVYEDLVILEGIKTDFVSILRCREVKKKGISHSINYPSRKAWDPTELFSGLMGICF